MGKLYTVKSFFKWLFTKQPRTPEWLLAAEANEAEKRRQDALELASKDAEDDFGYLGRATEKSREEVRESYQKLGEEIAKKLEREASAGGETVILASQTPEGDFVMNPEWRGAITPPVHVSQDHETIEFFKKAEALATPEDEETNVDGPGMGEYDLGQVGKTSADEAPKPKKRKASKKAVKKATKPKAKKKPAKKATKKTRKS